MILQVQISRPPVNNKAIISVEATHAPAEKINYRSLRTADGSGRGASVRTHIAHATVHAVDSRPIVIGRANSLLETTFVIIMDD